VRLIGNPVAQFLSVAVLLFVVLSVATSVLSGRVASREASADARSITRVLGRSVAQPAIPKNLVTGDAGAIDRLDREVLDRLLVGQVRRVKIWRGDGTILYSDETRLIGARYPLDEEESAVLAHGGTVSEVSDLTKPENKYEVAPGGLVEVYTRIRSPEGEPMLFELYFSAEDLARRRRAVFAPFQRITVGGLLAMLLVATPIIAVLTHRLTRAARERERLLRSSMTASEAERRRIARDLHDGVVQDLAGTAFSLTAVSRDPRLDPALRDDIGQAGGSIRGSLKSLRSLLVSIHPPDLRADGLQGALTDLVAPAAASGVAATVSVDDIGAVSDDRVALVWRVAQEAVRNALRHARAATLDVAVRRDEDRLTLTVTDDGTGFDPHADRGQGSFGLRGLSSLVADAGGTLGVTSHPGAGTEIRMEVSTR
jgi:two-component system, NarL family, sensor kinase